MADRVSNPTAGAPDGLIPKTFRDLGDGTFAEVVALGADDSPITLTGDLIVDTLGALDNSAETDPAAASATIPALLRGILLALSATEYETVAASQTDQVMGATGASGDYLAGVLIVPGTTAAGAVSIKDGAGSAISIFAGGGVTALIILTPVFVPLGIKSASGAWKVTTGANVTAIGVGNFT